MAVTKINAKQIDAFSGSSATRLEVQKATTDFNSNAVTGIGNLTASYGLISNDMVINGNLTVAGDQLIANVSILEVEDLSIRAAKNAENSTQANGAGLQIGKSGSYEQSILWNHANSYFSSSAPMSASLWHGKLNGEAGQLSRLDTDDLAEGSSNLYFTNERVDDRVGALVVGGSGVIATYDDAGGSLTLDFDIDELSALGGTGVDQGDHFVFSDGGTEKKITFSNLEDAIFGNVSSDATIAAGGALTIANDAITSAKIATGAVIADGIAAGAVEHGALNDNIISGQDELAHADIVDADEMMISDGGVIKRVGVDSLRDHYFGVVSGDATIADGGALTIAAGAVEDSMLHDNVATGLAGDGLADASGVMSLDLNELTAADVDVSADSLAFVDASDNSTKKESIVDLVAGMAGPGLSAASGQLSIAAAAETAIDVAADSFRFVDASDSNITKTESIADLVDFMAGNGLSGSAGVLHWDMDELSAAAIDVSADSFAFIDATDGSTKKESVADLMTAAAGAGLGVSAGVLSVDIDELDAGTTLHQTEDHFMYSDNGTEKKIAFTDLQDSVFADVSGDATIAAGGALTIAAGAVQDSMLHDDVATGLAGDGLSAASGVMAVDLNELGNAVIDVGTDFMTFVDATDSSSKKESLQDYAAAAAGDGLVGNLGKFDLDIGGMAAELATATLADGDEFAVSDGGTMKKIDFQHVRDSVFADVSGDATIAAGGALTIANNAVEDSMLHDNVATGLAGVGLSDASGVMAVHLHELPEEAVAVNVDYIAFIDNTDNDTKKESVADFVSAITGTGLTATNGVISMAAAAGADIDVANDSFRFVDASDSNITKTESIADLMTASAGDGLVAASGVLAVQARKQSFAQGDFTGLACTLTVAPTVANSVQVFLNGQLLDEGASDDYTISGTTITLADAALALDADDRLTVHYL